MSEPAATPLHETLLRQCLAADPSPWYPKEYAQTSGIDRESLYAPLNNLRIAHLVELTEWIAGKGQGYIITATGREVLNDPLFLAQLREGWPATPAPVPEKKAQPADTPWERGEAARRAVFGAGPVRVIPLLILVNILAFAASFAVAARSGVSAMKFLGGVDASTLHEVGAVSMPDLAEGEWWRLVTNCFLHFGLMHITLNMTSLVLLKRVESLWGSGRFLVLYLICGVCGSCAAMFYDPGTPTQVVYLAGASGALWGVMASEVVWLIRNRSHLPPAQIRQWLQQIFFTLLLNVGVSMLPGISRAAHIGGGIAGALAATLLQAHRHGPPSRRALAGLLLALLPTLFLLGLSIGMERDPRLQPFVAAVYREQADKRLGRLAPALDGLEPQAEKLHLQESTKRDLAELSRVRDGLQGLIKQAKEAADWLKRTAPSAEANSIRDKGLALVEALKSFAEALDRQAGGEEVPTINEFRKAWQDAKLEWSLTLGKAP
jgi:rhomboid protease GluP